MTKKEKEIIVAAIKMNVHFKEGDLGQAPFYRITERAMKEFEKMLDAMVEEE